MVGRTKLVTPVIVEPDLDQPRIENAMTVMRQDAHSLSLAEAQHSATVRAVAAQVGYQLTGGYADPDLIQRDIAANMRRSVEACLEVGRGLVVLKAVCEHGNFIARLDVMGIETRVAQRFMQSAMRFSNASSTTLLKAAGNQTKLFEMLVLDDEQIEELELTGQTGELKLDDVATMSVKELRAKVRELKGDVAAKEEVLSRRAEQVNTLEEKLARVKTVPVDEVLDELHQAATKEFRGTRGALIGKFAACIEALDAHHREHGGDGSAVFLAGLVGQLQEELNVLRDRFGIPDVAPAMIPDFVRANFGAEG